MSVRIEAPDEHPLLQVPDSDGAAWRSNRSVTGEALRTVENSRLPLQYLDLALGIDSTINSEIAVLVPNLEGERVIASVRPKGYRAHFLVFAVYQQTLVMGKLAGILQAEVLKDYLKCVMIFLDIRNRGTCRLFNGRRAEKYILKSY
jgi:hypothetical protein